MELSLNMTSSQFYSDPPFNSFDNNPPPFKPATIDPPSLAKKVISMNTSPSTFYSVPSLVDFENEPIGIDLPSNLLLQFRDEFWKSDRSLPLPVLSTTYSINPSTFIIDLSFSLRSPKDQWNKHIGRTLSQSRYSSYISSQLTSPYSFSFSLFNAPFISKRLYFNKLFKRSKFNPLSLSTFAVHILIEDFISSWIRFLSSASFDLPILSEIFFSTRSRFPNTFQRRMELLKKYSHISDSSWNEYIAPLINEVEESI